MKKFSLVLLTAGIFAHPAFAHHPLGGEVPQTMIHGLLSGIGHPIIGFDHLAFVLGVGLLAAFQKSRLVLPVSFVGGTALGTLLIVGGITLPVVEIMISLSVLLVGFMAMAGRQLKAVPAAMTAGFAGLFHGWAYGEAVVGAEATPLVAYVLGFGVTQLAIACGAMAAASWVMKAEGARLPAPRFAGATVAGVGLTYLVEIAESLVFPAM